MSTVSQRWKVVAVCDEHARTSGEFTTFLEMLGIKPTPRPPRPPRPHPKPKRARRGGQPQKCGACGQVRAHYAHSWCEPCHRRWHNAGRPPQGPPPPLAKTAARKAAYQQLRAQGMTDAQAAAELGVTPRTLRNYRNALQREAS